MGKSLEMKKIIHTQQAPAPIGPYKQATVAGNMVFVSGQIAIDPQSNELKLGNLAEETHLVLKNLGAVLEAAGSSYEQVLKCSIFLSSMDLFAEVNEIYAAYFPSDTAPARECVAVKTLPKNVNVEISAIALVS